MTRSRLAVDIDGTFTDVAAVERDGACHTGKVRVARSRGCAEVLSFDMGGTTAKVCLIEDGESRTSRAFEGGRSVSSRAAGCRLRAPAARCHPVPVRAVSRSGHAPIRLSRTRPCGTFALAVPFRSGP